MKSSIINADTMTDNTNLHELLSRLPKVRPAGDNEWMACCPAHRDRNPSLSVSYTGEKILIHCFAGCKTEDVLQALGLTYADLFSRSNDFDSLDLSFMNRSPKPKISAKYNYTDDRGKLLFQVVRLQPKSFRQRRPDGNGGWIWNMKGTERVLYRLPRLHQAIKEERDIYLVEGEKDVHALENLGLAATSAPLGAGKWQPQYTEALEGANVVVLPDNDEAGFKHAEMAAHELYGKAESVRIVELPDLEEGEDVSDWLANGGTKELRQLTAEADLYEPAKEEPELATPAPAKPLTEQEALGLTRAVPEEAISKLPGTFLDVLEHFDDSRERDVLLAGMLGVMSGCLPHVKGAYHRGRYAPNLFFFIAAPAGSGKGVLKRAREIGEKVHTEIKRESIDEIRAWEEAKENGEQDLGPKPSERWPILPANISAAAFMKALDANDGWGIMIETEADTLTQTLGREWGEYSDMLQKAHPHEAITNLRMEGGREIREPCLSVIFSGTPQQLPKLLPSIEDGLWSRFCFYGFLPDNPESWKDVSPPARFNFGGVEHTCQSLSEKVYNLFRKLSSRKSDLNVKLQEHHWDMLNETGQSFKKRIFQQFSHTGASVAHRMGLHIFRIAMVLAVWRQREKGADLGNVGSIEASDEDFEAALLLGKLYAEHSFQLMFTSSRKRLGRSLPEVQRRFYRELPDRFQTKEAVDLTGSLDISKRSAKRYLKHMVKRGILIKVKRGYYRKP